MTRKQPSRSPYMHTPVQRKPSRSPSASWAPPSRSPTSSISIAGRTNFTTLSRAPAPSKSPLGRGLVPSVLKVLNMVDYSLLNEFESTRRISEAQL